tara:strand:- start:16784 stop:17347 length:564 start_codon:yes stop_codon:yes gene_type:complete
MIFRWLLDLLQKRSPVNKRRAMGYGMGMTYDELLADTNDFNVANGFFCLIGNPRGGEFNASFYTPAERPIMLTWHANGIIGNGGFQYLFQAEWPGDLDYSRTVEAHRLLGCRDQVNAFELALKAVASAEPDDSEEKHRLFLALPDEEQRRIDRMYFGNHDDGVPERQIAAYIRANAKQLSHLRGRTS